jgi:hypothetical protein
MWKMRTAAVVSGERKETICLRESRRNILEYQAKYIKTEQPK